MKEKEAYLWWNAGTCYVLTYPDQEKITSSNMDNPRHVIYRARKKGYNVKVYCGRINGGPGSYVLKAIK